MVPKPKYVIVITKDDAYNDHTDVEVIAVSDRRRGIFQIIEMWSEFTTPADPLKLQNQLEGEGSPHIRWYDEGTQVVYTWTVSPVRQPKR